MLGFLFSGTRGLSSLRSEAVGNFFDGMADDGTGRIIIPVNIYDDLIEYAAHAANLATAGATLGIGGQVDGHISALRSAHSAFLSILNDTTRHNFNASEIFVAYAHLHALAQRLHTYAEQRSGEWESPIFTHTWSSLTGASIRINNFSNLYNSSATEFNNTLNRFPAFILRVFGFVRPLELFQ